MSEDLNQIHCKRSLDMKINEKEKGNKTDLENQ
jgi:hypothetical protein